MMQINRSLVGRLSRIRAFASPLRRRIVFAALIGACGILALFPQPYRAVVTLTPTDPASLGLSGTLGQFGAMQGVFGNPASLLGNQSAVEISLRLSHSDYVRQIVAGRLKLDQRIHKDRIDTLRWLDRKVNVRSLRGGIIEVSVKLHDAELARDIAGAYSVAVREQLALISRRQTADKRDILVDLVEQSSKHLAEAQDRYDSFRLRTRYSSPQTAIMAVGERIPRLEEQIKQKQVQLNAAHQFFTDDNLTVRQIVAEIGALQLQLADARSTSPVNPSSVGSVVRESTEIYRLRRNLEIAQLLYDNYKRFLQGTSVEDLTSTANIRILESAYIDSERQYNLTFVILGVLFLLTAVAIEFYQLRPPLEQGTRQ